MDVIKHNLLREGPKLADSVKTLDGKEKEIFLDFVSGMLQRLQENGIEDGQGIAGTSVPRLLLRGPRTAVITQRGSPLLTD